MRRTCLHAGLALLLLASAARGADIGVFGRALVLRDNPTSGHSRLRFRMAGSGVQKGADGDAAQLSATLDLYDTATPCNFARFELGGAHWKTNAGGAASYVNRDAPGTGGAVAEASITNGRSVQVIGRGRGDGTARQLDLSGAPLPSSAQGITAVLTVRNGNDGSVHRMCTRFAAADGGTVTVKPYRGGGHRLIAKGGVPSPCGAPQGGLLMQPDHAGGFFSLPWPNDIRRTATGALDTVGYPSSENPIIATILTNGSAATFGFGTNAAQHLQACVPLDAPSLPDPVASMQTGSPVMLVDLDQPGNPRAPLLSDFKAAATPIRPGNLLTTLPYPGHPLREHTRYALIVFDGVTAAGQPLRRAPLLDDLDAPWDASQPVPATTWDALRAQRDDVFAYVTAHTAWTTDDVVAFTVFTTQTVTADLDAIAAAVAALPSPTPVSRETGYCEFGGDRTTIYGQLQLPKWQAGTYPYLSAGGAIVVSGGVAVQQGTETVTMQLTLPCGPAPAAGWPILLFMDGTGANANSSNISYLGGGPGDPPLPYVVASIAPLFSGDRAIYGLPFPYDSPSFIFFNYLNPVAGRTNQLQQAADMMYLRRVVEGLTFSAEETGADAAVATDDSLVVASGHSQGALTIPHVLAADAAVDAGFISSGGGGLFLTVLHRGDTRPLLDGIAGAAPGELDMFHPVVQGLQILSEVGDAANYAPRVTGKHVLSIGGTTDGCSPLEVVSVIGTAMGLPVANPLALPMFGTAALEPPAIAFPVGANLAGGATGTTVHVSGGHFGSIANPTLGRSFVDSLAAGGPVVDPVLPLQQSDPFGVCFRYDPLP